MKKNKKFAGFSLIELLVVIAIMGVLATISISTFSNYREKARLATAQHFAAQADSKLKIDMTARELSMSGDFALDKVDSDGTIKSLANNGIFLSSGTGAPFVLVNDSPYDGENGKSLHLNNAYALNTTGLYAPLTNNQFTASIWVKLLGEADSALWMEKSTGFYIMRGSDNATYLTFAGNNATDAIYGTEPLNDGKWHHLLGSYDGTTLKYYIDGKKVGETSPGVSLVGLPYWGYMWVGYAESNNFYAHQARVYPVPYKEN